MDQTAANPTASVIPGKAGLAIALVFLAVLIAAAYYQIRQEVQTAKKFGFRPATQIPSFMHGVWARTWGLLVLGAWWLLALWLLAFAAYGSASIINALTGQAWLGWIVAPFVVVYVFFRLRKPWGERMKTMVSREIGRGRNERKY